MSSNLLVQLCCIEVYKEEIFRLEEDVPGSCAHYLLVSYEGFVPFSWRNGNSGIETDAYRF